MSHLQPDLPTIPGNADVPLCPSCGQPAKLRSIDGGAEWGCYHCARLVAYASEAIPEENEAEIPEGTEVVEIKVSEVLAGGYGWLCSCGTVNAGFGTEEESSENAVEHVHLAHRKMGSPPPLIRWVSLTGAIEAIADAVWPSANADTLIVTDIVDEGPDPIDPNDAIRWRRDSIVLNRLMWEASKALGMLTPEQEAAGEVDVDDGADAYATAILHRIDDIMGGAYTSAGLAVELAEMLQRIARLVVAGDALSAALDRRWEPLDTTVDPKWRPLAVRTALTQWDDANR